MKLTISMVTMNNLELNRNCLASIFQHTKELGFKVSVLDNNSNDGTVEMIRTEFPQVELIESKVCRGFTPNQNILLNRIESEYLLILNNDTIFLDNSIKKMVDFMDNHPRAGAGAFMILNEDMSFQTTSIRCDYDLLTVFSVKTGLAKLFPKSKIWGRPLMSYADRTKIQEIQVYSGACAMIRKKAFDQVGAFDENILLGPDDYDYSLRLRKKGWSIFYLPQAKVVHLHHQTIQAYTKGLEEEVKGIFYLYKKHYGKLKLIILKVLMLYGAFLKYGYWICLFFVSKSNPKQFKRNIIENTYYIKMLASLLCAGEENMSERWEKAQEGESQWWLSIREKIVSTDYREKIKIRALRVEDWLSTEIPIHDNSRLLEIGGGATQLIDYFDKGQRFAVDPLADVYQQQFADVLNPETKWSKSKAEKVPFENDSFDVIISRNVLDHVDSMEIVLREIHRVLKKDGLFYIGLNTFSGPYYLYKLMRTDPEHPYTFTPGSLKARLERSGFKVVAAIKDAPENMAHFTDGLVPGKLSVRKFLIQMKYVHFTEFLLSKI